MQANIEQLGALKRRVTITIPDAARKSAYETELDKVAKTVDVKGYRKGKAPKSVIEMRYGDAINQDVKNELIEKFLRETLEKHKINPVSQPEFEPIQLETGKDLEFAIKCEIYPEIKLADTSAVSVEKPVAEITDVDVDTVIEKLQKQYADWEVVERKAKEGDKVIIDFEGLLDGEAFDGGTAKEMPVELGSKSMIEGFESGIVGMAAGDEKDLNLQFPEAYHAKHLAGKPVVFKIKVHKVMESKVAAVDEEFAKKFDIDGVDNLRKEISQNLKNEADNLSKGKVREVLFDKLAELHEFELPQSLIDREIHAGHQHEHSEECQHGAADEETLAQAKKRVKLGLLVAELIKHYALKPDQQKMRDHFQRMAMMYGGSEQVLKSLAGNQYFLQQIESTVLEEQLVDKLLEVVTVVEKPVAYNELNNSK